MPLLHTWSLAVEEQFYLLFPTALIFIFRKWRTQAFSLAILGTIIGFFFCIYLSLHHPAAAFYLLPARGWELLTGCSIALLPSSIQQKYGRMKWSGLLSAIGLFLVCISYFIIHGNLGWPGYKAALPVLGTAMVIIFSENGIRNGIVTRILSNRITVFIGKISYSLYLWHWPILVFLKKLQERPHLPGWAALENISLIAVFLTFAFAISCYLLIERPLRSWNKTPLLSFFIFIGIAISTSLIRNIPAASVNDNLLPQGFEPLVVKGKLYCVNQVIFTLPDKYRHVKFIVPQTVPDLDTGVVRAYGGENIDVLVIGDSHSLVFAPLIDDILKTRNLTGVFYCADATPPTLFRENYVDSQYFGTKLDLIKFDNARKKYLEMHPHLTIWIQRYDGANYKSIAESIKYVIQRSPCIFVQQPPILNIGDLCTIDVFGKYRNIDKLDIKNLNVREKRLHRNKRKEIEKGILHEFMGNDRFHWFETESELLLPSGKIRWYDGNSKLYYLDDDHLSEYGVELFRNRLDELIIKCCYKYHQKMDK